jgi:glycerol-3-phosphate acyltransferase PlsY
MIVNSAVTGVAAVALAYLIGGFPSAYLVTRLATGKDIRRIGAGRSGVGNAGARNVYVNVGKAAGAGVFALDVLKGAAAVAIAIWIFDAPRIAVLGAGVAAVAGHIWPIYLRFVGGGGLATAIGVLAILMNLQVIYALCIGVLLMVMTDNIVLSAVLSLLTIPLMLWGRPWWIVTYPIVLMAMMMVHSLPNIMADMREAGSIGNYLAGFRRHKGSPAAARKSGKRRTSRG